MKNMKSLVLACIFYLTIINLANLCTAYRVLGVFPFQGKSHSIMFEALSQGLAERGHQVDVISHFPLKNPPKNYRDVVNLEGTMEILINNYTIQFASQLSDDVVTIITELYGNRLCHLMGLPEMQKFIKNPPNDPPYDVVLVEAFTANCFFGFGHLLNVPVIAVTSAIDHPWINAITGNCDNLAIAPSNTHTVGKKMNFWDRVINVYYYYTSVWNFQKLSEKSQTESMRKYLKPDCPDIREVEKSVALTIVNTHPKFNGIKPITPGLVQVGGLHVPFDRETMGPELKKWMDESTEGVVFFTLGSLVIIESMEAKQLKELYSSFKRISPVRVLMKIADERKLPPGLPKNVKTLPWIPQQAVLKHTNTKAFITHCGMMGLQESVYYGVPMIGIPLYADQYYNAKMLSAKNVMVSIDFKSLTENTLNQALDAILKDPSYKENAKRLALLFKDNLASPMDTAAFWIEYVIRNGADVLKSPGLDFAWWQIAMIDVYGFYLSMVLVGITIVIYFLKKLIGLFKTANRKEKRH